VKEPLVCNDIYGLDITTTWEFMAETQGFHGLKKRGAKLFELKRAATAVCSGHQG
jgi:hypothetical protein